MTLIGERNLFRATYLEKIGPLHICFMIFEDPANEYLKEYPEEVRQYIYIVEIIFYS